MMSCTISPDSYRYWSGAALRKVREYGGGQLSRTLEHQWKEEWGTTLKACEGQKKV